MYKKITLILILATALVAFKSDNPAYLIYSGDGLMVSYEDMLTDALKADIVLFGEYHDNPISHWLELELATDMAAELGHNLVLGAEMFETDEQLLLTEYVFEKISTRNFESQARLWPNYKTDYKPLVKLARKDSLNFIATNVPRRYAGIVSNEGFEGLKVLDKEAKRYIAPMPIPYDPELPSYQAMLEMGGAHGLDSTNFPKAQALKDATMAHFILENLKRGQTMLHFNGAFHSDDYEGIGWYLNHYDKKKSILTISTVSQAALDSLETDNLGKADYIIVVRDNMTSTR